MAGIKLHLKAMENADPAAVIRLALRPRSLTEFGDRRGFSVNEVSQCLRGYRPHDKVREALAEELGVTRAEIDALLDTEAALAG